MLKKRSVQIAVFYTVSLLIVSLITVDFGGLDSIVPSYGDKIFHFTAYGLLTLLWFYAIKHQIEFSKIKTLLIVGISCAVFGTIVEVLQKVLTISRFYDEADMLANILGVMFMSMLIVFVKKTDVKKY
ncbi:VanZ family protein [Hanstruepera ponticola]|uniref:VanZ family protein n=1 Tax=Hanstruepera ponticola TaxID=2042995 RepID=UPI000CF130F7|nr:VanZ family protein [Hanstruepera ponticola]